MFSLNLRSFGAPTTWLPAHPLRACKIRRPSVVNQLNPLGSESMKADSRKRFELEVTNQEELEVLKKEVKMELISTLDKPVEHLGLIDAIERLGVGYHFSEEIQDSLVKMYHYSTHDQGGHEQGDLYHLSLEFRLFRQHGFFATSDVFKKFTDESGNFVESLTSDVPSMLSLYEASHFRVHGEGILEKALSFTTRHLTTLTTEPKHRFHGAVERALAYPLQKALRRVSARYELASLDRPHLFHSEALVKFARLDFNVVQAIHKEELQQLTRWSDELCFDEKFPFARDRVVESYFWAVGVLPEPKYSLGRIMFTKAFYIVTALDDLYDSFGMIEEMKLFATAVERWDERCLQRLPESMKTYYKTLLDTFDQIEEHLVGAELPNYATYVIQAVKYLSREYIKEFKWREAGSNTSTYEEFLSGAARNTGINVVVAFALAGLGKEVKKEDFECAYEFPKAVVLSGIIGRLISDIVQYEFDSSRGHFTSVGVYMKHHGLSKEETCVELYKQIEEAWIDMNEEMCLQHLVSLPKHLVRRVIPTAQLMNVIYNGEDGYGFVSQRIKDIITSMFIDEIDVY